MRTALRTVAALLLLTTLAAPAPALAADPPAALATLEGGWTGTNKLWFMNPKKPLLSDGTATLSPGTLAYTWAYKGAPQQGTLQLTEEAGEVTAVWTDTWHSPKAMTLEGTSADGKVRVLGSYGPPPPKAWGWRIELGEESGKFVMRMYNITPAGKEMIAVEMIGDRKP